MTTRDISIETVTIPMGDGEAPMAALAARPAARGRYPACLVFPEIFGWTDHIRDAARRLAALGYLALVPDVHHRATPGAVFGYDEAGRAAGLALLGRLTRPQVLGDLARVLTYVNGRPDATGKTGVVGFSAGGHIAYLAATALDVRVIVSLYGGWIANTGIPLSQPEPTIALTPGIARRDARVLYIVGADDHLIGAEERAAVRRALGDAGVRHDVVVYPGVQHGFLFDGRPAFDAAASADAWTRVAAALAGELQP